MRVGTPGFFVGSYRSKVGERVEAFLVTSVAVFGGYGKVGCEDG